MMKKNLSLLALAVSIAASVMVLASCDKKEKLNLYTWTYYTPKPVIESFEKDFSCKVIVTEYDSNETMFNKLVNGGAKSFDLVVPSQDYVSILMKRGMLQPIVQEKFTNRDKINPEVLEKITYDSAMIYAVPYYYGAAGISVNRKKVPGGNYERTWNIFSDSQFRGHASMMDDYREVLGDALKYSGFHVSSTNENELDTAVNLIRNFWLPNIVKFDAEGFGKDFARGDLWLCHGYAEVIYGEVPESEWSDTIDFFIPEDGGASYLDSFCILENSKKAELATEFINYIHKPENYAQFLDFFRFPAYVNLEAENFRKTVPLYSSESMKNCELKDDIGNFMATYYSKWEKLRLQTN